MSFLYQCPKCKKTSLEEEWNEATYESFGVEGTIVIPECWTVDETIYLCCPECNDDMIFPSELVEVKPMQELEREELHRLLKESKHPLTHAALQYIKELEREVKGSNEFIVDMDKKIQQIIDHIEEEKKNETRQSD